jgi:hypothetical protein
VKIHASLIVALILAAHARCEEKKSESSSSESSSSESVVVRKSSSSTSKGGKVERSYKKVVKDGKVVEESGDPSLGAAAGVGGNLDELTKDLEKNGVDEQKLQGLIDEMMRKLKADLEKGAAKDGESSSSADSSESSAGESTSTSASSRASASSSSSSSDSSRDGKSAGDGKTPPRKGESGARTKPGRGDDRGAANEPRSGTGVRRDPNPPKKPTKPAPPPIRRV